MSLGKRRDEEHQQSMWIETESLVRPAGHPFYQRLNEVLKAANFDTFTEKSCAAFYSNTGRPGLAPGVYFRCLLVGYFEGLDSERGIAWRVADSLALRSFLGFDLNQNTPDHSTISRTRRLIDLETHRGVFVWVLEVLAREGLLKGETVAIDGTTLEANAALRSIVRRDTGQAYEDFLRELARESGIETPMREQLAKLDRKRPKKGSNDDWTNPNDPDAQITRMKDGRTHLAHKAEHAVDLDSGAVLAVTVQPATAGDTHTFYETLGTCHDQLSEVYGVSGPDACGVLPGEVIFDKGYHSNDVLMALRQVQIRSYCSEPDRGRRNWVNRAEEKMAVYANRRRIRSERGRRLLRRRGEYVERSFAHLYETGGMRRTHLRRHGNILKRLLIHASAFNLGLLMRKLCGAGTPRQLRPNLKTAVSALIGRAVAILWLISAALDPRKSSVRRSRHNMTDAPICTCDDLNTCCTSGC